MSIEDIKNKLQDFFARNDNVEIKEEKDGDYTLCSLWRDNTVDIRFDPKDKELADALNSVYLPPRYSAIHHIKEMKLEVIYTVILERHKDVDTIGREFTFEHKNKKYHCKFDKSSDRLMLIARHFQQTGSITHTNYRNLPPYSSFTYFLENKDGAPDELKEIYGGAEPLSFWIDVDEWDDDVILDMIRNLNFYMTYFDRLSPTILVHSPPEESRAQKKERRYPFDKFPKTIRSTAIDGNLLHLWHASLTGDPARRFLYSYQVIEYAAYYVLEEDITSSVRRILASPDALNRTDEIASEILEVVGQSKLSDPQKIETLFRRVVRPARVWQAMEDKAKFCRPTKFDGGYEAPAIIQEKWTEEDFTSQWPVTFANVVRNMRNALSHGREQRMSSVITPTAENMRALQPWVPLIAASAREVMVYRNV